MQEHTSDILQTDAGWPMRPMCIILHRIVGTSGYVLSLCASNVVVGKLRRIFRGKCCAAGLYVVILSFVCAVLWVLHSALVSHWIICNITVRKQPLHTPHEFTTHFPLFRSMQRAQSFYTATREQSVAWKLDK